MGENSWQIKHFKGKKRIATFLNKEEVGYLTYRFPDDVAGKKNLELVFLYVKPEFRRMGIATVLLQFILKAFSKVTWISFWTGKEAEVDQSYPLYLKNGFQQLCYQEDYYEKGIGTRLFAKKMTEV